MDILLVCGGGMSSSILAENLEKEAMKRGEVVLKVEATGTERVHLVLQQKKWDMVLLAPQVSFRKKFIEKELEEYKLPLILIEGILYTPMGVPKLYDIIMQKKN